MNFETLKRSHLKRNIIIGVIAVLIISAVVLNFTRAKYRVTQSIPLVNGTINYTRADLNVVAMYQKEDGGEYTSIDKVPSSGYALNEEESYCEVDGIEENVSMEYKEGKVYLGVDKKGTKCYLYFDELVLSKDILLTHYPAVLARDDFSSTVTSTTTGTIYKSANSSQYDDDGEVYYFAGNPTDNWVRFAGFYWRIIRINGDGTIRLIYSGEVNSSKVEDSNIIGTGTQITVDSDNTFAFNSSHTNNAYVGYMYQNDQVHGLQTSSTIKEVLDIWYQNNLENYASYLDGNVGFCNDRTPYSGSGIGTSTTYYAAQNRLETNKIPSFKCSNSNDLFTVDGNNDGNKSLTNPIGLITADEVTFAGGLYGYDNKYYYLYTSRPYYTITPYGYLNGASVFTIFDVGRLATHTGSYTYGLMGVRPVINLKADSQFTGNGTTDDPYVVS